MRNPTQRGMFLIEALVAILIFSLGVLGLLAMSGAAVSAQSDAQYRTEAAHLADEIVGRIVLNVNRAGATPDAVKANIAASLLPYAHHPDGAPDSCVFSGGEAIDPVKSLADNAAISTPGNTRGLPGTTTAQQQVRIDTGSFNRVEVTLCWQTPSDAVWRHHTLVSYVN